MICEIEIASETRTEQSLFARTPFIGWHLCAKSPAVIMGKNLQSQPGLTQIVDASRALGASLSLTQRGQQYRRKNGDDGDDTEQLDKGESAPHPAGAVPGKQDCTVGPWRLETDSFHKSTNCGS